MTLEKYNKKRKFSETPEPEGKVARENHARFVIQRHQATRLHYDLRLEMDGVLKSWAVPKGPSMNPEDKRLAIMTEDHPVAYLTFQGKIPKGNYGAGVMDIWDTGTYEVLESDGNKDPLHQIEKGDLKISFFGEKIKGTFALVQMHRGNEKNQWLLIKKKDAYATGSNYDSEDLVVAPSAISNTQKLDIDTFIKPMLATSAQKIFKNPKWVFEMKWDGYRILAHIKKGKVILYSRNGVVYNQKFSSIATALAHIPHNCILDGEVVLLDKSGKNDFQKLQNYDVQTSKDSLKYYVFDLLHLNGIDTISLTLLERKSLLPELLNGLQEVLYCDHLETMGPKLYKMATDAGMEGVMAKKSDSIYVPGYRSENWVKIKNTRSEEALICGYTDSNSGGALFGSLILGMFRQEKLTYVGNCGSGFSNTEQKELLTEFKKLETDSSPFDEKIALKGRKPHWLKPTLICEVKFSEFTKKGVMRHPIYKGLRYDKSVDELVTHNIEIKASTQNNDLSSVLEIEGNKVAVTNLDKIYWPAAGYTKYDLIDYYLGISEYILPYLKNRPQSLHRHPNGILKPSFYHKDQDNLPDWLETFAVYSESSQREIDYLLCQNEASLLYMANLGCIEINPWHSVVQNLNNPTYTIIDIDPSEKNTFEQVIEVALAVKEVLILAGIKGYPKTSGSSGIHVYIPLQGKYSYDEARDFTKLLCYYVADRLPELTTMERAKKNRNDKIYLDFLQNRKGQTIASAYCARPKQGAPVSAPLLWEEVKSGLQILDFTIKNLKGRLEQVGDLFLPVLKKGIDMEAAITKLSSKG